MTPPFSRKIGIAMAVSGLALLSGCGEEGFKFPQLSRPASTQGQPGQAAAMVERDVEAPDIFQVTDRGLWDGRPSLGGVWVAHPDAAEPERVIIRNQDNGKSVVGALFRKEAATPGPAIQVSSDAAQALEMLAGAPATLSVIALRKEEAPAPEAQPAPEGTADITPAETAPVTSTALDAAADATPPAAAAPASTLRKPFIQTAIFTVEANAQATADRLTAAGMPARVVASQGSGRNYFRVVVGPAQTSEAHAALMAQVKAAGFADAYAVSN